MPFAATSPPQVSTYGTSSPIPDTTLAVTSATTLASASFVSIQPSLTTEWTYDGLASPSSSSIFVAVSTVGTLVSVEGNASVVPAAVSSSLLVLIAVIVVLAITIAVCACYARPRRKVDCVRVEPYQLAASLNSSLFLPRDLIMKQTSDVAPQRKESQPDCQCQESLSQDGVLSSSTTPVDDKRLSPDLLATDPPFLQQQPVTTHNYQSKSRRNSRMSVSFNAGNGSVVPSYPNVYSTVRRDSLNTGKYTSRPGSPLQSIIETSSPDHHPLAPC